MFCLDNGLRSEKLLGAVFTVDKLTTQCIEEADYFFMLTLEGLLQM